MGARIFSQVALIPLLAAGLVFGGSRPAAAGTPSVPLVRLPGHVLDALKDAKPLPSRHGADAEPLTLTIVLKRADQAGFDRYLSDVYNPRSPRFRRFLSQPEITERFGPSVQAYNDLLSYLRRNGFRIVQGSANRMTVTASGTRAQTERAFATRLRDYEGHGRRFFANDADPAVPAHIAGDIQAVVGLSNLAVPQPAQASLPVAVASAIGELAYKILLYDGLGNSEAAAYFAEQLTQLTYAAGEGATVEMLGFAAAEDLLPLELLEAFQPLARLQPNPDVKLSPDTVTPGSGQKIGILAFSSINLQDVADWLALTKQRESLANQVSQVAVNGGAPLSADETDILMAVDTILTVLPGAQVVVYHAPKGSSAPGAGFQMLFNAMIADHVTVISNSSSYCEDQTTLADAQSIDSILATAAAAGITVLNATGDSGGSCSDGSANTIAVPADSPNATAVGATSPTYGPAFTYGSETWLNGSSRTPPTVQSGYGVSKFFAIPPYQTALISGSMRSVPDVVSPGDPQTGIGVCQADNGGCPPLQTFGGTSLSTPFWASVAALINQLEGHPVGNLNSLLYPLSDTFHSAASMGTDPAHVGLGSPNGDLLALALLGKSAGPASASRSTVQATSPNPLVPSLGAVPADGTSSASIVVLLQDANGSEIAGKTVTLSASGGHAVITPSSAVTNTANGAAIFKVTDTAVENLTFTAQDQTDGITLIQTATINFVGPPATAGGIGAFPTTVASNGSSTTTITVTLQDANGSGASGKQVTLSQGSGQSIITAPSPAVTNANGQIQFTATDTANETVTYTAIDATDGLPVPGSASVTFSGAASSCVGAPPSAAAGFTLTPFASGFLAENFSYSDVNWGGCPGASNPSFDSMGSVYVADSPNGNLYELGPAGGSGHNEQYPGEPRVDDFRDGVRQRREPVCRAWRDRRGIQQRGGRANRSEHRGGRQDTCDRAVLSLAACRGPLERRLVLYLHLLRPRAQLLDRPDRKPGQRKPNAHGLRNAAFRAERRPRFRAQRDAVRGKRLRRAEEHRAGGWDQHAVAAGDDHVVWHQLGLLGRAGSGAAEWGGEVVACVLGGHPRTSRSQHLDHNPTREWGPLYRHHWA